MTDSHVNIQFTQHTREGADCFQANVAVESPVTLSVNGIEWLTFQCTPVDIKYLGVGFLYNEGFVKKIDEIENAHICDNNDHVDVWLNHAAQKPSSWRRTAGCHGGTGSAEQDREPIPPVASASLLTSGDVFHLMDQFLDAQLPHLESGGVHTSALADGNSQLFQIIDIGRHNTIDKIAGKILLDNLGINNPILITTGRISSDMVEKAARIGAPFLISMRSASQMGLDLAEKLGITLIGGARRGRFNLFTHPQRIQ